MAMADELGQAQWKLGGEMGDCKNAFLLPCFSDGAQKQRPVRCTGLC